MKKIVYVMDPQCGWCYGNGANITAIAEEFKNDFSFELLVGGMWLGNNAPNGGRELSVYLQNNAPRMAATTKTIVGDAYYELAKDNSYTFSSMEPSAAIQLIKEIAPDKALLFAKSVQDALIINGKRLNSLDTYLPILKELEINRGKFEAQWMKEDNIQKTNYEFTIARKYANGFPTLVVLEGEKILLSVYGYFNKNEMASKLNKLD